MTIPPHDQPTDAPKETAPVSDEEARIYMDASLHPHRSLSPKGFALVMAAVAICGSAVGFSFFLAGAWPVAGFAGLEILLLYFAFKINFRDARRMEHIRLTDQGLEITRVKPNGKSSRVLLEPTWLQVMMDDPPEHHSQLVVASRGKGLVLGSFLTPGERLEVAKTLQDALARYRAPEHLKV
ncbi:DUF2244 domain-containing protein [Hwanghaeella sp.]|uniref:DUF2244 domain-containing protein n=1 Tax=Hwanghaeella sp. TaxID=2605943 RepID=UPI003CCBE53A